MKFSFKWKSSTRASKQRKYRTLAPSHVKHEMVSAHLSKELRKRYSRRNFPVRKGDTVEVEKGSFKGKKGKILEVDTRRKMAYVDGMMITKKDGSKVNVPITISNFTLTELNLEDKKRLGAVERKIRSKK